MFFKFILTIFVCIAGFSYLRKNWPQIWSSKIFPFLEVLNERAQRNIREREAQSDQQPITEDQAREIRKHEEIK